MVCGLFFGQQFSRRCDINKYCGRSNLPRPQSLLCRHLGVAEADDDMHRLAFAVTGMGLQMMLGCEVVTAVRPQLLCAPQAIEQWSARLVGYAEALIAAGKMRLTKGSP